MTGISLRPPTALLALLLLAPQTSAAAQEALSVGVVAIPAYQIYNGRVNLSQGDLVYGGQYLERTDETVGVRASVEWQALSGAFGVAGFVAQGASEGRYGGLAAPEEHRRDLLTLGVDLGWRPEVLRAGPWALRVPFGPTVTWQRLRLSEGHRDAHATPATTERVDVDWSDRSWLSMGGHAGVAGSLSLGSGVAVQAGATARFLYYGQGAWSGQEERDIKRSTGRTVHVGYEDPIIYLGHVILGLEWRPERR